MSLAHWVNTIGGSSLRSHSAPIADQELPRQRQDRGREQQLAQLRNDALPVRSTSILPSQCTARGTPGGTMATPEVMERIRQLSQKAADSPTVDLIRQRLEWLMAEPSWVTHELERVS